MAVVTRQQRRPFHVVLYMRQRPGRGPAKRTRPAIPQIRDSADTCAWNASGSYWAYPIWDRAATRSNLTGVRPTRWRDWSQAGHQLARLRVSAAALPGAGKARYGLAGRLQARLTWRHDTRGAGWPRCMLAVPACREGGCGCDGRHADRGLCSGVGP